MVAQKTKPKARASVAALAATAQTKHPMLSVIVPVYNSTGDLRLCLAALANSQYADFEALVVDDGSTEPVKPVVDLYQFKYMRIDGPSGPARARNRGAATLNGQYLVFIDADVCVHPDTLTLFAERFTAEPQIAAVIGSYDDHPAHPGFLSRYKNLFHHYVHQQSDGAVNTFWSGCGAMRREVFFDFGGFDEQRYKRPAIEDIELGTWVSAAGHKIVLDSRIKAKHLKRWTLRSLLKTDVFDRGVPWTRLMLRAGSGANTLNVKLSQRICVALTYGAALLALIALISRSPWALLGAAALALTITVMNFDFYRFYARHANLGFALRVVPLHWLYFFYCGFSVVWGTLLHYLEVLWKPSYSQ